MRLGIRATLVTVNGHHSVTLLDLSETGARLRVSQSDRVSGGILKWMGFDAFGSVIWQNGEHLGLSFEHPIERAWLLETREWLPTLDDAKQEARRFARKWASGSTEPADGARSAGASAPEIGAKLDRFAPRRHARIEWLTSGTGFLIGGISLGLAAGFMSVFF